MAPFNSLPKIRKPPTTLYSGLYDGRSLRSLRGRSAVCASTEVAATPFVVNTIRTRTANLAVKRFICLLLQRSLRGSLKLLQLRVDGLSGKRKILSVAHDFQLAFLAQDEAQKFQHSGIHWLAGCSIGVGVDAIKE